MDPSTFSNPSGVVVPITDSEDGNVVLASVASIAFDDPQKTLDLLIESEENAIGTTINVLSEAISDNDALKDVSTILESAEFVEKLDEQLDEKFSSEHAPPETVNLEQPVASEHLEKKKAWLPDENGIIYEKLDLKDQTTYYLVISEAKFFQLAHFLRKTLAKFIRETYGEGVHVDFIYICPTFMTDYSAFEQDNVIVINPTISQVHELIEDEMTSALPDNTEMKQRGIRSVSVIDGDLLISRTRFAALLGKNKRVKKLMRDLKKAGQDHVGVLMFENVQEVLGLDDIEEEEPVEIPDAIPLRTNLDQKVPVEKKLRLLGPKPEASRAGNNKVTQYKELSAIGVPVVPHDIIELHAPYGPGYDPAIFATELSVQLIPHILRRLETSVSGTVFVTAEYSAGGSQSAVVGKHAGGISLEEVIRRWSTKLSRLMCPLDPNGDKPSSSTLEIIVSEYIEHIADPSVHAVVAPAHRSGDLVPETISLGIVDMVIEGCTTYRGMFFPTRQPKKIRDQIVKHTDTVGKWLAERFGYSGLFGCDFIVTADGRMMFVEVNARKQGSLADVSILLEHLLPEDAPTPVALEFFAFMTGKFPENALELIVGEEEDGDSTDMSTQPTIPTGTVNMYKGLKLFYRTFKIAIECPPPSELEVSALVTGQPLVWKPAITVGEIGRDDDFKHRVASFMKLHHSETWTKDYSIERALVRLVANREIDSGYVIVDYPGPNVKLGNREIVARIIAVGYTPELADLQVEAGKKIGMKLFRYLK